MGFPGWLETTGIDMIKVPRTLTLPNIPQGCVGICRPRPAGQLCRETYNTPAVSLVFELERMK